MASDARRDESRSPPGGRAGGIQTPIQSKEIDMNARIALSALCLAVACVTPALAADSSGKAQANRMSQCSTQAKEMGLKGDARKEHMSQCLRNPNNQAAAKECNASATEKGLKGQRRREFVSECVKSKGTGGSVS